MRPGWEARSIDRRHIAVSHSFIHACVHRGRRANVRSVRAHRRRRDKIFFFAHIASHRAMDGRRRRPSHRIASHRIASTHPAYLAARADTIDRARSMMRSSRGRDDDEDAVVKRDVPGERGGGELRGRGHAVRAVLRRKVRTTVDGRGARRTTPMRSTARPVAGVAKSHGEVTLFHRGK